MKIRPEVLFPIQKSIIRCCIQAFTVRVLPESFTNSIGNRFHLRTIMLIYSMAIFSVVCYENYFFALVPFPPLRAYKFIPIFSWNTIFCSLFLHNKRKAFSNERIIFHPEASDEVLKSKIYGSSRKLYRISTPKFDASRDKRDDEKLRRSKVLSARDCEGVKDSVQYYFSNWSLNRISL